MEIEDKAKLKKNLWKEAQWLLRGVSSPEIWDPKTAILANMICTRNVGQKLKSDIWLLCATLYPFGGTGRIQYVTKGRGEYEVTYLFDPTWTYRLNHKRFFVAFLVDKKIRGRSIVSTIKANSEKRLFVDLKTF